MTIEEAFYTKVAATAGLTAIISTRCYPHFVPQHGGEYPCITYSSLLEVRGKSNAGTNGLNKTNITVTCWETTEVLAGTLAAAFITAFKDQSRTTWGTVRIAKCDVDTDDDMFDQTIGNDGLLKFGVILNAAVWYFEA